MGTALTSLLMMLRVPRHLSAAGPTAAHYLGYAGLPWTRHVQLKDRVRRVRLRLSLTKSNFRNGKKKHHLTLRKENPKKYQK